MKSKLLALILGLFVLVGTACATVSTSASEIALQYEGGPFDSSAYHDCFNGGTKEYNDVGDEYQP